MDLGHCGGTWVATNDQYAPVLRPETGTRIVVAGSGIGVFCRRLAPMALGKRRAQQLVQVLVAERVEIGVARRARSAAEVRIGGDDLGPLCDRGAGEDVVNRQVHAVGVSDADDEYGRGQRVTARGEEVVVHADRLLRGEDVAPDPDECGLDRVPGLDPLDRRRRSTPLRSGQRSPVDLDRKSTRLNSSHLVISYAVFCLKKK